MESFQPDHPQLLINTDWGAEDESPGLVKWEGRWVTPDEKKRLKQERWAYSAIRVVGLVAYFGGGQALIDAFTEVAPSMRVFDSLFGATAVVAAFGLLRYRGWARYLALAAIVGTDAFGLLSVLNGSTTLQRQVVRFLLSLLVASYLFNRNANLIFGPPAKPTSRRPILAEHRA